MNNILQLKGEFHQASSDGRAGPPQVPKNTRISVSKIIKIKNEIISMKNYWEDQNIINGALVDVFYNKVAAKSNRIKSILSCENKNPSDMIVGARYAEGEEISKHIITYFVPLKALSNSIDYLQKTIDVLNGEYNGEITDTEINPANSLNGVDFRKKYSFFKTRFRQTIVDICFIERMNIPNNKINFDSSTIVTLYKTNSKTKEILRKIGIDIYDNRIIDDTTVYLNSKDLFSLNAKAPFLISMATEDISKLSLDDIGDSDRRSVNDKIPLPGNEPTVGVIDTLFDEDVYFNEWVECNNLLDKNIISGSDYFHGTTVSSIIVDGPHLNPELDDGCGRFKVRHFGVSTGKAFSSFYIIKKIKEIVNENRDIHVWNLSLGSDDEINNNFISAEGAVLDDIQFSNDVIFVIAGTNGRDDVLVKKIGAPADSINSMVVNSVEFNGEPSNYSRRGIVLSFFTKPDVSYYGGSRNKYIKAYCSKGRTDVAGTSYAAPWIARKLSYLIDIIGLNKETAKALIIDSAIGWNKKGSLENLSLKGNGVVPVNIEDILHSANDEIRFLLSGTSEKFDTYNYKLPVPTYQKKYPYVAKATMCYFPKCSRNEGVDYTNTELDLHFGRIDDKGKIKTINNNKQSIEGIHYLFENDARKQFKKWDNVKHIGELFSERKKPKKMYDNHMWGISIKTKERLNNLDGQGIKFGVVVTLKEINGVNRIDDFIQQCSLNGWFVNELDVKNKIDIFQTSNEEISFK